MGNYAGSPGSDGFFRTGTLNVYPGTTGCSASGPCLDPTQPNYQQAIKGIFLHEFLHALRVAHSSKANVMNIFSGVNNAQNANQNLDCVLQKIRALRNPPGQPPAPTCP